MGLNYCNHILWFTGGFFSLKLSASLQISANQDQPLRGVGAQTNEQTHTHTNSLTPFSLKRDYNKNGTHPSGMWGSQEGLNPKFQSLCSKNGAAQAPTPPRNDEFCLRRSIFRAKTLKFWIQTLLTTPHPTSMRASLVIVLL